MKSLKTILLASFLAVACALPASAQTVVRITGSTAFRSATHTAITNIFAAGFTFGYTGASASGASQQIYTGTVSGNSVIIKTSWSGAVGGVQTVARNINVNFLPNSTPQSTGGTSGATVGAESALPDVCMTDNYQSSTIFPTPALVDQVVGVVLFKWVASIGAPAGLANINPQQAQALFGNGDLALALFTGLSSDRTTLIPPNNDVARVFATGRDPDSGTRLTTFAESGVGVNSQVVQYEPTISGSAVTGHAPWHPITVNGIPVPLGNGGYSSGGTLATTMTKTTLAGIGGYYVSYLSTSDAATAIAGGAKELTYNGIPFSLTAVQEGQYTFWGYEHLMYRSTYTGVGKTVADILAQRILNFDSPVLLSAMKVSRPTDGGLVTPNY